jgi:hypothetical protein
MTTRTTGTPNPTLLDACPACGAVELSPVFAGEQVTFLCPRCMSCWHIERSSVHKINPETCPGCQYQLICIEYQAHDR